MHKHYPTDKIPDTVPVVPQECQLKGRSGAVLELDIVQIIDIKVERVDKNVVTGLTYGEIFDKQKVHYRPVAKCILSDEHKRLMGVDHVWVDMDGLAADDANESLLDDCVLRLRRSRKNASKEYIKMLSGTQLALAGTEGKNEEAGKLEDKTNPSKPAQPEEKK